MFLAAKLSELMLSWRELNQNKLPDQAKTWQNTRFVYHARVRGLRSIRKQFQPAGRTPDYLF